MKASILTTLALVAALAAPASLHAEDSLAAVRDLYAAAEYEDALKMLERLDGSQQKVEHIRYQVFCLLALDRTAEAEKSIARILEADPLFAPDRDEASPRVVEMFDRVRGRMAPRLAKALYAEGKAALDRKEHDVAVGKFELLLKVLERTGTAEDSLLGELKLLAEGFVDLARSAAPPVPAAPLTPTTAATRATSEPLYTPAVPVSEKFPLWSPSGYVARGLDFKGVIRVRIGVDGKVQSVEMVESVHPTYDWRLLDAAERWRYQPATRQGTPIESERVVTVHLKQQ